jgi:hypothetical protein
LLKTGLLGGALLFTGGLGLSLWPTRKQHAPVRALEVLDERAFAVLAAITATMIPSADPIAVAHFVDETFAARPPAMQRDLLRLLALVESGLWGALLDGRPRPFTRLPPEGRVAALEAMRDSRLALRRSGYQVLRRLAVSAHWCQPARWAELGYAGPPELVRP